MKYLLPLAIAWLLPQSALAQPAAPDSFIAEYAKEHGFNGSILCARRNMHGRLHGAALAQ